jgi:hypothetical protein
MAAILALVAAALFTATVAAVVSFLPVDSFHKERFYQKLLF